MTDLMTESTQQASFPPGMRKNVAFSNKTGSGRFIPGLKQFRDVNADLCTEITDQKAYAIHPAVIHVTPGFNSREMGMGDAYYQIPEVTDHINNIKAAYIRGDYVDPIRVRLIDGTPFVRQGHCRLRAAQAALNEGHEISILCIEIKEDEVGCELATIDGNRGLALSPVALGESYRRLQTLAGWSIERIAQRENKSTTTISSLIRLTSISVVLKKLIHADAISYVAVLDLLDQFGESEAILKIEKMIADLEQADSNGIRVKKTPRGQVRVVPSDFKPARIPPVLATKVVEGVKVLNEHLLQKLSDVVLPEVSDSSIDEEIPVMLNRSTLEMLKSLHSEITEAENKQLRRAENRQAKLNGEPTKKKRGKKGKSEADQQDADNKSTGDSSSDNTEEE